VPVGFFRGLLTWFTSVISSDDPGIKMSLAVGRSDGQTRTLLVAETGIVSGVGVVSGVVVGD
jgi:hypothetical protein